jgi:hypothetical protein
MYHGHQALGFIKTVEVSFSIFVKLDGHIFLKILFHGGYIQLFAKLHSTVSLESDTTIFINTLYKKKPRLMKWIRILTKRIVAIEPYENRGGYFVFVKPDGHFPPPIIISSQVFTYRRRFHIRAFQIFDLL